MKQPKKHDNKSPISLKLDKDLLQSLDNICKENNYSRSFVLRELIKDYIEKERHNLFNKPIG